MLQNKNIENIDIPKPIYTFATMGKIYLPKTKTEKNNNNNNIINIVSCIYTVYTPLADVHLRENLNIINQLSLNTVKKKRTVFIFVKLQLEENIKRYNPYYDFDTFYCSYFELIDYIIKDDKLYKNNIEQSFKNILINYFYSKECSPSVLEEIKNRDIEIMFIFRDLVWSNILILFKLNNINIFGGTSSKRHVISTLQLLLSKYLLAFGIDKIDTYNQYTKLKFNEFDKLIFILNEQIDNLIKDQKYDKLISLISQYKKEYVEEELYILELNLSYKLYSILTPIYYKIDKLYKDRSEILYPLHKMQSSKNLKNLKLDDFVSDSIKNFNSYTSKIEDENNKIKNIFKIYTQIYPELFDEKTVFVFIKRTVSELLNRWDLNFSLEDFKKQLDSVILSLGLKNKKNKEKPNNKNYKNFGKDKPKSKNLPNSNKLYNKKGKKGYKGIREYSTSVSKFIDSPFNKNKSNFSILEKLDLLNLVSPQEVQLKIEEIWIDINKKIIEDNSTLNKGINLKFLKKAKQTLELKLKNKQYIKMLPDLNHLYGENELIMTYTLINIYYTKLSYTSIAYIISYNILKSIYIQNYLKNFKNDDSISALSFKEFKDKLGITKTQELNMATFFIDIFCNHPTPIFIRMFNKTNLPEDIDSDLLDKDICVLKLNAEYSDKNKNSNFFIYPGSFPLLCPPNEWSDTKYGGLLLNNKIKEDLITGNTNHNHTVENRSNLYKAVNILNSVKFKINNLLLNYLMEEGKFILNYYLNSLKDKTAINQNNSTLYLAHIFSNLKIPFYINVRSDWRGRLYGQSFYLNYQGNELSNSLLEFYDGKIINETGKFYLYIYGANCYNYKGLSKKSLNERHKWVLDNYEKIIKLDFDFIKNAESVLFFTSFCLVMREIHNNPNYKVHIPIFLDATCSGIQHLSALIKDLDSGFHVNLIKQDNDSIVNDIYSRLLEPINELINQKGRDDPNFKNFEFIKLERKHVKTPIMTKTYNVKILGIKEQLMKSFVKREFPCINNKNKIIHNYEVPCIKGNVLLSENEIYNLAVLINKQIFDTFPSLQTIFDYFQSMVKIFNTLKVPLNWITPAGLQITQEYNITNQKKVSIVLGKKSKTIVIRERTNKLDTRKQINAIIPNIIHSLDASHLMNILIQSKLNSKITNIVTVHDCFGAHPNEISDLKILVLVEFIKIYSDYDFLSKFHSRAIQSCEDNHVKVLKDQDNKLYIQPLRKKYYLPELPKKGELDLIQAISSKHFIT